MTASQLDDAEGHALVAAIHERKNRNTMSENTITNTEQMEELSAGQWALTDDGKAFCLYDTHMGFPQRMWGSKAEGGTKGAVRSYTSLETVPLPLHLAEIDSDFKCPHAQANECGQCAICGSPGVSEARPIELVNFGEFQTIAEHNSRVEEATK
jgi:hypothetical protein